MYIIVYNVYYCIECILLYRMYTIGKEQDKSDKKWQIKSFVFKNQTKFEKGKGAGRWSIIPW